MTIGGFILLLTQRRHELAWPGDGGGSASPYDIVVVGKSIKYNADQKILN